MIVRSRDAGRRSPTAVGPGRTPPDR